jgi:hypothetical protein
MKRTCLYAVGIVVALIPAVLGLTGNSSFSQAVPVHVHDQQPARVTPVTPSATSSATPSGTSTHDARDDRNRDDSSHHGGGSDDDGSHGHGSDD